MANPHGGWVRLPVAIVRDTQVSAEAKIIFADLLHYDGPTGCHPKIASLMRDHGLSKRTVLRRLDELEAHDYLRRQRRGRGNTYILNENRAGPKVPAGAPFPEGRGSRKVPAVAPEQVPETREKVPEPSSNGCQYGHLHRLTTNTKNQQNKTERDPRARSRETAPALEFCRWFVTTALQRGALPPHFGIDPEAEARKQFAGYADEANALLATYDRAEIETRAIRFFDLKIANGFRRPVNIATFSEAWDWAAVSRAALPRDEKASRDPAGRAAQLDLAERFERDERGMRGAEAVRDFVERYSEIETANGDAGAPASAQSDCPAVDEALVLEPHVQVQNKDAEADKRIALLSECDRAWLADRARAEPSVEFTTRNIDQIRKCLNK